MIPELQHHLQRLRTATTQRLGRRDLADWISQNTYINGRKYSYAGHEFQRFVLEQEAPEVVVIKSAQMGCSEIMLRLAAALPMVMPGAFRVAYVLPTASFATSYAQTRFNPVINGSPALRAAMSKDDVDRADTKTFGDPNKVVYFKGAAVGNAAISTTLDALVVDENDFCSQEVIGDYHSRLIHSPYKWRWTFSTPTFPGGPIDTAYERSKQYSNMCRCPHCNTVYLPDYFDHVVIPGCGKGLDEITSGNLHTVNYLDAYLACPKCGKPADLSPEHRFWHCANPDSNYQAVGVRVQPFDAPTIVTIPDLVVASTKYASLAKFKQFSLGRPAVDRESGVTDEDVEAAGYEKGSASPFTTHVMGADQGNTCHIRVGGIDPQGRLVEVHRERVPLGKFKERVRALKAQYRVQAFCMDMQPNVYLAMELAEQDSTCFPAMYSTKQGLDLFAVQVREADAEGGVMALRQVAINRNALFDKILAEMRLGHIKMQRDAEWETMKTHMQDMKRAEATLRNGEFTSLWVKTSGNDHYMHALGYLYIAAQLRGMAGHTLAPFMFTVGTFKVADPDAPKGPCADRPRPISMV